MFIDTWIQRLALARTTYTLCATLLTYIFWWSSVTKIIDFGGATAEMAHFGLQPAAFFAALTIGVQLAGSALVIGGGRWVWLGAGALIVMTLGTLPVAHRYREMTGMQAMLEKAIVQEHFTVIGGLLVAVVASRLRLAQDARR
jgi:transmembrane protein